MSDQLDVAEVLERAAEVIEEFGWCQNMIRESDGRVCLMGAIEQAVVDGPVTLANLPTREQNHQVDAALFAVDDFFHGERGNAAIRWNDTVATDKYEVIDLLKSVAKSIRNGEVQ